MTLRVTIGAAAALALAACALIEGDLSSLDEATSSEAASGTSAVACMPSNLGVDPDRVCRLSAADVTEDDARTALGDEMLAFVHDGSTMTVFTRYEGEGQAQLCCTVSSFMDRIGETDLWAIRLHFAELDRGMLTFLPPAVMRGQIEPGDFVAWRGPDAPAAPAIVPVGELQGQVVDRTLWSERLQETRRLTVYLPPGHDPAGRYPALFRVDGPGELGMIEALIASGAIPPIVVVGMPPGPRGIVEDRSELAASLTQDLRSADYLPRYNDRGGERFDAHLRFVADEVVAMAVAEYAVSPDAADHIVHGSSSGGMFALEAGLRRPDAFGTALPMSVGWMVVTPEHAEAALRAANGRPARFLMNAGLYEPGFLAQTNANAETLTAAGFDVQFESVAAGHATDQWEHMLARNLVEVLGPKG
jgi:enterochelin esterase-like enzyme